MQRSSEERDAWRLEERRKESRYTLILRAGVLEQEGKTSFCLIKNISTTGVQLKAYSQVFLDRGALLRVGDEQPVTGSVAWTDGDIVGISLHEELDTATLLRVQQKLRSNKRRAFRRMSVESSALLRTGGQVHRATVQDISSLGARVRGYARLRIGDRTIIELADLPSINAYVRWADGEDVGLAFETPVPIQIIANWIDGRSRVIA
jgi:hypothetical protein